MEIGSPYSPLKMFHHQDRLKILHEGGQPAPAQVQLVISDLCNHDCPWCAYRLDGYTSNALFKVIRGDGSTNHNPNRMIPLGKVEEILDDCREMGIGAVQITGGGEPTVHPHHPEIFGAVLERGLDLALVSNGTILRGAALEPLLKAKWVRFSLDAGTAETYATERRVEPKYFERFKDNVRQFCDARDALKSQVIIGIGFVVTRGNWKEIVKATKIARHLGADNIRLSAVFQSDDERYFADFHAQAAALCREAQTLATDRFQVFNNFGDRLADLAQHAPDYKFCGYQNFSTYIGADLNCYRCCVQAYNERGLIGSIKDQRFKDLWDSQAKRDDFAHFDARECQRCMFNEKNRTINYALAEEPAHVNFV
jgi:MoaA/NifB/PqqE/SkfB family radical SAM enzyme